MFCFSNSLRQHLKKILLFSGLSFSFCTAFAQPLKIILFNKSGYKLDSLYFENQYLGCLEKDSSVTLKNVNSFVMQSQWPLMRPRAVVAGKKMKKNHLSCSTKARKVDHGNFSFDIFSKEDELGLSFYWSTHQ